MKKRIVVILLLLFLAFSPVFTFLNVDASSNIIIYQNENVLSEGEISEVAMRDKSLMKNISEIRNVTIKKDGHIVKKDVKVGVFEYTQTLMELRQSNGETTTFYSTTSVFFADLGGGGGGPMLPGYDSAQYGSKWDGSIGVKASSTIYWQKTYDSYRDLHYVNLVMTDGKWEIFDIQLSIASQQVVIKQAGLYYDGNVLKYYNNEITKYPTSGSFLYYSPVHFEMVPVFTELTYGIGTFMSCYVVRGTSTWYLEYVNIVAFVL